MTTAAAASPAEPRGFFAVPAPVRELFKLFPLHVYPAEPLPLRAADLASPSSQRPRLFVFSNAVDARDGRPSYNPSCLKWQCTTQTILRVAGVDVELVPSNNHASPSGALPFLLPSSPTSYAAVSPLTSSKIGRYAQDHAQDRLRDESHPRLQAYQSLLTQNIRPAWLYALYLLPANDPLLASLYLPSSPFLRLPLRHSLHTAATTEILKTTRRAHITPVQLYTDAAAAFRALSTLLADDEWFFGADGPGAFDADVFAYTYLILDDSLGWQSTELAECLTPFENLLRHRQRLYDMCWGEKA
ncbi:Metaxin-1 [Paramyrothecium foliicola]|nr:Metaxin-1 [Paramyrothecium foliicola]